MVRKNLEEKNAEKITELIIEQKVMERMNKWYRTVCITATSTAMGFFLWLGGQIYDKFDAVSAGVRAFFTALRNGS